MPSEKYHDAQSGYVNDDLAHAVRDVVQISRNGSSQALPAKSRPPVEQNPFEGGEFETSGQVPSSRPKFKKSSSEDKDGRSKSSGSGRSRSEASKKKHDALKLSKGQSRETTAKKGSRHADVIDRWDPTGLGHAMWHHSGPYDAAAPSRNVHGPQTKAPMQAFSGPAPSPIDAPPRSGAAISIGTTPNPRVDAGEQAVIGGRRPSGAATRRRSSGGLSNPYSSSLPASGGFFPDTHEEETDESEYTRRERDRQREEKYRALQAAWGIDTPEPYEDFGSSPRDETGGFNEHYERSRSPLSPGGKKIIGFGGPRSPPIDEDGVVAASPQDEFVGSHQSRGSFSRPAGGGVKRTKSLMQRLKGMRGDRSHSPHKQSSGEAPPLPSSPAAGHERVASGGHRSLSRGSNKTPSRDSPTKDYTEDLEPVQYGALDGAEAREELEPQPLSSKPAFPTHKSKGAHPVMPVMPDFDDLRQSRSNSFNEAPTTGSEMGRKTSIVKRFKGKVAK